MFVLLLILIVVLLGLGFLSPLWWVAAAVLVYAVTRHGRDRGGGQGPGGGSDLGEYQGYRERRDREERWNRRYSRQNRARWRREDRRDREHRG
ncbi:hypothetical protein [Streptomyces sp. NPDC000618]|uniref:hypothetical protein n=1 Tax=Streptomyces sp. NPDC000618 TaxID=3154265 RepID=UPI003324729C